MGLGIFAVAKMLAFQHDRSFYPTVLIVIASYYVLFAVMAADRTGVAVELGAAMLFVAISFAGLRAGCLVSAGGILLHGLYDLVHRQIMSNHGAPNWWPTFCGALDLALGMTLLIAIRRTDQRDGKMPIRPPRGERN